MKPLIGILGLGSMGDPIARRLVEAGYIVVGHDINPAAAKKLATAGGRIVSSTEQLAKESDLLLVLLVDDLQVRDACTGAGKIIANMKSDTVVVIMSSVSPDLCLELANEAESKGVHVIDAPMVRGEAAASAGTILLLLGGSSAIVRRCLPVFKCFATDWSHLGAVGSGQVAKMANNMLLWSAVVANYESLEFARSLGIDLKILRETLKISSGDNWALRSWDLLTAQAKWWDQKDLSGLLETAKRHNVDMPLTRILLEMMKPLRPQVAQKLLGGRKPSA